MYFSVKTQQTREIPRGNRPESTGPVDRPNRPESTGSVDRNPGVPDGRNRLPRFIGFDHNRFAKLGWKPDGIEFNRGISNKIGTSRGNELGGSNGRNVPGQGGELDGRNM